MKNKTIIIVIIVALVALVFHFAVRKKSESQIQKNVGTNIGEMAPDFSYTTIDGKTIESASLRGKVVVLTSSAAWCPTCAMEAQQFAPIYQKYKDAPVYFISIDIDPRDGKDFIAKFKKDHNTPWDYADAQGGRDVSQKFQLNRFEITYILDKNGIVRFKDSVITSSDKLDAEIKKLL